MISLNVSSYWPEWTADTPWDVTKSNSLLPLPRAYMLIISTDAPVNSILRRHETRGATCTRAEMILTCVRWILSFLHTLHHRWPLHHTATYSHHIFTGQESPKHVIGNYPSLSEEIDCYRQQVPLTQKKQKHIEIQKQEHVNILQRLPQSVLMSL